MDYALRRRFAFVTLQPVDGGKSVVLRPWMGANQIANAADVERLFVTLNKLIAAKDEDEAFQKALAIGQREQDGFYNHEQQLVQWKFINVAELYRLSGLLDGAEMYSRIQETDDAEAYIDLTNRRADHIRISSTHKILNLL